MIPWTGALVLIGALVVQDGAADEPPAKESVEAKPTAVADDATPLAKTEGEKADDEKTDDEKAAEGQAGKIKVLEALVLEVKGRVQWRADAKADWRKAARDDVLKPGAEIRTGLRSSLALRVGKNATLRIGRSTRIELPTIVQKDDRLETRAVFHRGKADFKVDAVGFENDFKVVTPTTTLAVRGTGFSLQWGSLRGVEVRGLPTNEIHAIEMNYFEGGKVLLSGDDASNDATPEPARLALGRTVAPPPAAAFRPSPGQPGSGPRSPGLDHDFRQVRDVQKGGSEFGDPTGEAGGGQGPPAHGQGATTSGR
jgi:hypothetical protein